MMVCVHVFLVGFLVCIFHTGSPVGTFTIRSIQHKEEEGI